MERTLIKLGHFVRQTQRTNIGL